MDIVHNAPSTSSFTPLPLHQSQTPDSFFSGPPILYHYSPSATLSLSTSDLASSTAFSHFAEGGIRPANSALTTVNGDHEQDEGDEEVEIQAVDIWVTSERLILYSPTRSIGISIPYPTLSLHAIQSEPPSLFLQLLTSSQTFDDHDPDSTISLIVIPSPIPASTTDRESVGSSLSDFVDPNQLEQPQSPSQTLYTALTSCANLHPDPLSGSDNDDADGNVSRSQNPAVRFEGETDGDINSTYSFGNSHADEGEVTALPPPIPGSGGWITAENVGEFFDEEGNWRAGERWTQEEISGMPGGGLGSGAGNVRAREEDVTGEGSTNGEDETKWRRTD